MRLEVKNIIKTFGEVEILHGVSFTVENGRALGLLGRNGAGKTTTIRILMDIFRANSGEILLDGQKFQPAKVQIGYLPEERGLYPKKTVMEQLIYLARLRGLTKKQAEINGKYWLKRLEVEQYETKKLETLSKGNQQKVQLASTLVSNPDIIILDEPFSGLDPVNAQILKDVVVELIQQKKIVIFSSHQMSYVEEFCEDIAIIDEGNVILNGNLKEIKREFGKNRLILSVEGLTTEELVHKLKNDFSQIVEVISQKKDFAVIELAEGVNKWSLLGKLEENKLDIVHFGIYEPSLNDIFVAKVGDDAEEVK